ncbi:hypothetical protein [Pseudomonas sp. KCJK8670]|uniref:hypothetical protein n=1 Tax=Pseudomonas sp. KCJK8670 TaxID=3344558 RepID=UPI00390612A2
MNAVALITNHESDYRAAMQQAAVAFLFRREGLHLAGDHQVLENCRQYLGQSLEVPANLVQRIAELAVAEFESKTTKRLQLICRQIQADQKYFRRALHRPDHYQDDCRAP